jgi:hypothetical protein
LIKVPRAVLFEVAPNNLMLYCVSHFLEIYCRPSKWNNEDNRHKKVRCYMRKFYSTFSSS